MLKYHVGCGRRNFKGYLNVDFPRDHHIEGNKIKADIYADIKTMQYDRSEEIRSHHVFEHFGYVDSFILLIKWTLSLVHKGTLIIEVPDVEALGAALNNASFSKTSKIIRYLFGDQGAHWAYHINGWTSVSLRTVLNKMGYRNMQVTKKGNIKSELPNCSILVKAFKQVEYEKGYLIDVAKELLFNYLNCTKEKQAPSELVLYNEYCKKLLEGVNDGRES